jgi:hypothetical protein
MAWNKNKIEDMLNELTTGDLKYAPHDLGIGLRDELPLAPELQRQQYVEELLRVYSTESRPVKWNIMHALEGAVPSFSDQRLQVRLYSRVIDLVVSEDKTKPNEHNWPRDFGMRVIRCAKSLDADHKQELLEYIDKRISDTQRYNYPKSGETRDQLRKIMHELE